MYNPKLKFSDMQIENITSKHFNYHLKELISSGYIQKTGRIYELTSKGKDYVGKLDEKTLKQEIQPKVSVFIYVARTVNNSSKNKNNDVEYLINRRLKQPYFGRVGGFSGKVRFGETFEDAARRELFEETGLTGDFQFCKLTRKIAFTNKDQKSREFVQDNIIAIFLVKNVSGELIGKSDEMESFWQNYEEIKKRKDLFNTFLHHLEIARSSKNTNPELIIEAEGY